MPGLEACLYDGSTAAYSLPINNFLIYFQNFIIIKILGVSFSAMSAMTEHFFI